jgi:hypothetical protein
MTIQIFIDYRMCGSTHWSTIEFSPEEYFDLVYEKIEEIEYYSIPEWDHAIEYLDVDPESIANTRLRIKDTESKATRTITTTFWNAGKNQIIERIDKEQDTSSYLMIVSTLVQEEPTVWEIMRFQRNDDVLTLEYHSFINDDGSELEGKIFPV